MSQAIPGIDRLLTDHTHLIRGRRIGLLCNQATVTTSFVPLLDALLSRSRELECEVVAVFGPQHGIWGHTQDNMIEWEGYSDPRTGLPFYSLYGERREPQPNWLEGIDLFVADLPDIGSRYYTFIWTLGLCMRACERADIPVLVLDRPNPIGGARAEGFVLNPEFSSFVGLHPMPQRHGMTLGEIAQMFFQTGFARPELEVLRVVGWDRADFLDRTGIPWVMPSPNMPCLETALVYPGACLIEGTLLSEGRGTTRPFEIVGAPYIDGWRLAETLNRIGLPGVVFRPYQFLPTFQKHHDKVCQGVFTHVTDRQAFRPVLTTAALLLEVAQAYPDDFGWLPPPYEYEVERMPIDILAGHSFLREAVEGRGNLKAVQERMDEECAAFEPLRNAARLH